MYSFSVTYTNEPTDPEIVKMGIWVESDTTDTTSQGYANSTQVLNAYRNWLTSQPGYVTADYTTIEPHQVTMVRVYETEQDRITASENFKSNVAMAAAYGDLLNRYRAYYNITQTPAPGEPPLYLL